MNASRLFSRAFAAILTIFLLAAVAAGQSLKLNGATTLGGTWKVKGNIDNTGASGANTFSGTVQLTATTDQSIGGSGNAINFATLTATGASTKTFNTSSTITAAIDNTSGGATKFVLAASKKLTVQGATPFANTGSAGTPYDFSASAAEVDYNGGAQAVYATTYDKLTVSNAGSKTLANDLTVASALSVSAGDLSINGHTLTVDGSYTVAGTVTGGATSSLTLNGSGDIAAFTVTNGLNNLVLNRTGNTVTLSADLPVAGGLTLTNGTLAVDTHTLTLDGAVSGSGSLTSAATGTVDYAQGSIGQTVLAANYGNLTFSNFNKTLPNATVGIAGTFTPGTATGHTVGTGTIAFNGGSQSIPSFNGATGYNNFETDGTGTKTASGDIKVGGNFDNGGAGSANVTLAMGTHALAITGTKDNTGAKIQFAGGSNGLAFSTGTVEYNGDDVTTQTIGAGSYATLLLNRGAGTGTAAKLVAADAAVSTSANVTVSSNTSLQLVVPSNPGTTHTTLTVAGLMTVDGSLNNAGEITTTGDFVLNGSITNTGTVTVGQ